MPALSTAQRYIFSFCLNNEQNLQANIFQFIANIFAHRVTNLFISIAVSFELPGHGDSVCGVCCVCCVDVEAVSRAVQQETLVTDVPFVSFCSNQRFSFNKNKNNNVEKHG